MITSDALSLRLQNTDCASSPQFGGTSTLAAMGGYAKSNHDVRLFLTLTVIDPLSNEAIAHADKAHELSGGVWVGFGVHAEVQNASLYELLTLNASLGISAVSGGSIGEVDFFGVNLDTVTAFENDPVRGQFDIKTDIYLPTIYYHTETEAFHVEPEEVSGSISSVVPGEQIVLKACNRCARLLPIDIRNEQNSLGFSNHCVQRAPCQHGAFSRFTVQEETKVDPELEGKVSRNPASLTVVSYYGFQLECRACKKFKVNAPLNPMRNATQHREDGLRRRAFEQLVGYLLQRDWIFFTFRRKYGREFDEFILSKFDHRCFACGKALPTTNDMNMDHTLPLNYLWPLDDTATCLCDTCNSQKNDQFPFEFVRYQQEGRLEALAKITGLDPGVLSSRRKVINMAAVDRLRQEIVWFFDTFLMDPEYQKVRQGKKAADLIVASLTRIFREMNVGWNLVSEYNTRTGHMPRSVTID